MAKWTTTCFGLYWPSSGCLKRTGLGTYKMHCARTRLVEISTYGLFYFLKKSYMWRCARQVCGSVVVCRCARQVCGSVVVWRCARQVCGSVVVWRCARQVCRASVVVWRPVLRPSL